MKIRIDAARLFAPLIAANLLAWGVAFAFFHDNAVLLGSAFLAYTLGLRHAVDADHIAAIDNVTRKLMRENQRPLATGLYFSLGHSTVVWIGSIGIALAATTVGPRMEFLREVGGTIGTSVSMLFLFAMAGANILLLKGLAGAIRRHRKGDVAEGADIAAHVAPRGIYTWLLRPVFRMVSRSRHMFLVGFLFGLGFDTATEIGVLGLSAAAGSHGLPIWIILIYPALFTAGMSLVDTLDSALMTGAYGWAFVEPTRKLYYNFAVTFFAVAVALVMGGIEALALLSDHLGGGTSLEALASGLAGKTGAIGYAIVIAFAALWLASFAVHRWKPALRRAGK